jgi:hypothetical protein
MDGLAYLPGSIPEDPGPLARYLPPVPEGVAAAFLARSRIAPGPQQPGPWVLDPFGASPRLALELARLGCRVLVAVNNPVTRFLFEMAADPPPQSDLQAALADLAAARKGDERLETHIQSLYLTECGRCQRQVPAEAFIWERGGRAPIARLYRCTCGEAGEFPAADFDLQHAAQIASADGLHRSRALERVAAPGDPDRVHAEEALECYLPRAVYALITLVNRLDGLDLNAERRAALAALILAACDEANTLWPYPAERPRPRQLTVPPRFMERNVWLALERAVQLWAGTGKSVHASAWPSLPPEIGGLCLFEGPVRELAPQLKQVPLAAAITAVPRPNQAFWTLSALWAGWLWGREAAAPFKSVLRRRRYDWSWHAAALQSALKTLPEHIPLNVPLFGLVAEPEPAFLSAVLSAAAGAGFDLNGLALRTRHDPVQAVWHRRAFSRESRGAAPAAPDPESVRGSMQSLLKERGEPAPYLHLHAAGLAAMAADRALQGGEDAPSELGTPILDGLVGPDFVHHADSTSPEAGLWGLTAWDPQTEPLADRVEVAVVQVLQKRPGCGLRDLEAVINPKFPGLQTPSLGLLQAVLTSYAFEADGRWTLRPEDSAPTRRADLEAAARSLDRIAAALGYDVRHEKGPPRLFLWQEAGRSIYALYLMASALVGQLLRQADCPAERCVLVLPGGRAGLLAHKLERDPGLRSALDRFRVVKFRHLRRLAEMSDLGRERWEKELAGDPIEPPEQMKLF